MNYHNITKDDMNNGDGLRVVLWLAGCEHHCKGCQNPITWNPDGGLKFTFVEKQEIFRELEKPWISGLTLSGGDPLHPDNREKVFKLVQEVKNRFPEKTIWLYTGYLWENIVKVGSMLLIIFNTDVVVDGKFVEELKDNNFHWAGSTNQRVIDVKQSLKERKVVLYDNQEEGWNN